MHCRKIPQEKYTNMLLMLLISRVPPALLIKFSYTLIQNLLVFNLWIIEIYFFINLCDPVYKKKGYHVWNMKIMVNNDFEIMVSMSCDAQIPSGGLALDK